MKNILVTGAFGYVGGRISKYLSEQENYSLFLTSRKKRELPAWGKKATLVEFSLGQDYDLFEDLPQIDVVIHLAAVNEVVCSNDPLLAVELNTLSSFKLIQNAIKHSVKRFIYFSTAHVYGAPLMGEFSEESITRPTHPYSYTHRAVEDYIATAHDRGDFEGISLRLSNSLGEPIDKEVDRWMLLVCDLCKQVVTDSTIALKSYGSQKRDFIGLEDVCRAVEHVMNLNDVGNGIFNLGGNSALSIYDMACLVSRRAEVVLGKKIEVTRPPGHDSEWPLRFSSEKLKKTGFVHLGTIEKEIDNLLIFCSQNFGNKHESRSN